MTMRLLVIVLLFVFKGQAAQAEPIALTSHPGGPHSMLLVTPRVSECLVGNKANYLGSVYELRAGEKVFLSKDTFASLNGQLYIDCDAQAHPASAQAIFDAEAAVRAEAEAMVQQGRQMLLEAGIQPETAVLAVDAQGTVIQASVTEGSGEASPMTSDQNFPDALSYIKVLTTQRDAAVVANRVHPRLLEAEAELAEIEERLRDLRSGGGLKVEERRLSSGFGSSDGPWGYGLVSWEEALKVFLFGVGLAFVVLSISAFISIGYCLVFTRQMVLLSATQYAALVFNARIRTRQPRRDLTLLDLGRTG